MESEEDCLLSKENEELSRKSYRHSINRKPFRHVFNRTNRKFFIFMVVSFAILLYIRMLDNIPAIQMPLSTVTVSLNGTASKGHSSSSKDTTPCKNAKTELITPSERKLSPNATTLVTIFKTPAIISTESPSKDSTTQTPPANNSTDTVLPDTTSATSEPLILPVFDANATIPTKGYLVWTQECQIPDLDPFDPVLKISFEKVKKPICSKKPPLTKVTYDAEKDKMVLHYYRNLTKKYGKGRLLCYFKQIIRWGKGISVDCGIRVDGYTKFTNSVTLNSTMDAIFVSCRNKFNMVVYKNIHALVSRRESIMRRFRKWEGNSSNEDRPMSVLLIGIDSISRMNLLRVMPKTAGFVRDGGWFELTGYNKVGDNTYPNIMAILGGYNPENSHGLCKPEEVGGIDNCSLLWNDYRNAGYVTGYGEDETYMSTFNYLKIGFKKPPTDYYLRPTMMAAEQILKKTTLHDMYFCLGPTPSAKYVYDYALQMHQAYRNHPYFGLFWTNTFSHNYFDTPTSMDQDILDYLRTFNSTGVLNESIIIFFSDHGMRWGELRMSSTGHLEERLPFFYIWLPFKFQKKYPEFVEALKINKHRLTTPYDVHVTLKHILSLSGRTEVSLQAIDCPNCQTLFKPIPGNRSCEHVAIPDHWCTCRVFRHIDKHSMKIGIIINKTIDYINELVENVGPESELCDRIVLKGIIYSNQEVMPHEPPNSTLEGYQLGFVTNPGSAEFEATVRYDTKTDNFTVTGTISRLNFYAKQSGCVQVEALKKFCACKIKPTMSETTSTSTVGETVITSSTETETTLG